MKLLMILLATLTFLGSSKLNPKSIREYNISVNFTYDQAWKRCIDVLKYYPINKLDKANGIMTTHGKVYRPIYGNDIKHFISLRINSSNGTTNIKYTSSFCEVWKGECHRFLKTKFGWKKTIGNIEKSIFTKICENNLDNEKEKIWYDIITYFGNNNRPWLLVIDPINYSIITDRDFYSGSFLTDQSYHYYIKMNISKENKLNVYFYYEPDIRAIISNNTMDYKYCNNLKYRGSNCESLINKEDKVMKELIRYFGDEMIIKVK